MGQSYNIYWQKPLRQVRVPQHCEEAPQLAPWPEQLVPLPHTPLLQVSEPQHWPELEQEAPAPLQPPPPVQVPLVQLIVPQHCEELVQKVPALWQPPPVQTLLALQVSTPQQSPLDWQRWLFCWQGPVMLGSGAGPESPPPPQARDKTMGAASRAIRIQVVRVIGVVYLRFLLSSIAAFN
jgi:hypothetical protein